MSLVPAFCLLSRFTPVRHTHVPLLRNPAAAPSMAPTKGTAAAEMPLCSGEELLCFPLSPATRQLVWTWVGLQVTGMACGDTP